VEPASAVLGDINCELISTYRTLRRDATRVVECLLRLPITKKTYLYLRSLDPQSLSDAESAARFLFLNRLCFNGIYRTNLKGQFNVPYTAPKAKVRFDPDSLIEASNLLRRATLVGGDFEETLAEVKSGDLVYLDPPYAIKRRRIFAEYHPDSFSTQDLARLRASLLDLDRRDVHFVVSYADSAEGRALVKGWHSRRIRARRNVAGFTGHRRAAYEVLASNRECPKWV
jgi:DNA adenine methylase